jgi:AcrR family transcriptional regulator
MGIQERKGREKAELRGQILQAAMQIFLKEGFDGLSIRKIADAIEYSPATIYIYFKEKDEILFHLQAMAFEQLYLHFLTLPATDDPVARLVNIGRDYLKFGIENPVLYELMFHAPEPMRCAEALQDHKHYGAFQYLLLTVQEGIDKQLLNGQSMQISLALWMMLHGMICANNAGRFMVLEKFGVTELHPMLDQTMIFTLERFRN